MWVTPSLRASETTAKILAGRMSPKMHPSPGRFEMKHGHDLVLRKGPHRGCFSQSVMASELIMQL